MTIEEATDPAAVAAAADLWVAADEARAGGSFDEQTRDEQRAGFIHAAARPEAWLAVTWRTSMVAGVVGGFWAADEVGTPTPGTSYLAWLAVRPTHWGAGIGHSLLGHAEQWSRSRGDEALVLWVHDTNARARALYERRGWAVTGNGTRIPTGELRVQYRRTLSD